jgi:flagellar protein FliT
MALILQTALKRAARNWAAGRVRQIPTHRACYTDAPNWQVIRGQLAPSGPPTTSMLVSHENHIIAASPALANRPMNVPLNGPLTMPLTLIDHYKGVEDGSRRMLAAAHAGDWQQVALLEGDCKQLIQQLKRHAHAGGHEVVLAPLQRKEKQRIMQRILSADAQIRRLMDPWSDVAGLHTESHRQATPKVLH